MSPTKRNFYEILKAPASATFNELKSNYKQLILQCHPDKMQQQQQQLEEIETNNFQINDDPNNLEFIAITEAWNCLKDPIKRKQYDAEQLLNKFHTHNNIYAHIQLNEMKKQPNTEEYFQDDEVVEEEGGEKVKVNAAEEGSVKDEVSKYFYTYDCRCGGQYIVDESAEQYCRPANNHDTQNINSSDKNNGIHDDADNKTSSSSLQNDKNSPNNIKNAKSNDGGSSSSTTNSTGGSEGVVRDNIDVDDDDVVVDEEGGGELIVECSECSLVIILNG